MSLTQFVQILMARWLIVAVAIASCLLGALAVTMFLLSPRYEARARVTLDVVAPDPVTGELMPNNFLEAYVSTQAALITDYQTMGTVVDTLGWASNPIIAQQYAEETGGTGQDIRRWLADGLGGATGVRVIPGSNILEISYVATSPEGAKAIAELIRDSYIGQSLVARRQESGRMADWFRQQGDEILAQLKKEEREQVDYAQAKGIVFQANRPDLESSKLAALTSQSALAALPSIPMMNTVSPTQMQLDSVNQQIAQASMTLGPNHPAYQSLLRQRQVLTAEVAREASSGERSSPYVVDPAKVAREIEQQKGRVAAQHDDLKRLQLMQDGIELKRNQYAKAMQKAADLRLLANVTTAELTPFGEVRLPTSPSFPNRPLILGGAIILGGLLGVVGAILIEMLSLRIRSGNDLEFAAGVPIFATIADHRPGAGWLRRLLPPFARRAATQ